MLMLYTKKSVAKSSGICILKSFNTHVSKVENHPLIFTPVALKIIKREALSFFKTYYFFYQYRFFKIPIYKDILKRRGIIL
jgi:hypothetical protein